MDEDDVQLLIDNAIREAVEPLQREIEELRDALEAHVSGSDQL